MYGEKFKVGDLVVLNKHIYQKRIYHSEMVKNFIGIVVDTPINQWVTIKVIRGFIPWMKGYYSTYSIPHKSPGIQGKTTKHQKYFTLLSSKKK